MSPTNSKVLRWYRLPILLLAALVLVMLTPAPALAADEKYTGGSGDGFTVLTSDEMTLNGASTALKYIGGSGDGFSMLDTSDMTLNGVAFRPGDADQDGDIDDDDVTWIIHVVIGDGVRAETPGCDANEDGSVTILDITMTEKLKD